MQSLMGLVSMCCSKVKWHTASNHWRGCGIKNVGDSV